VTNCTMCDGTGYKDHAGFSMDPCDHVKNEAPKKDWASQWDDCDVCEVCGQLAARGRLWGRASSAITFLYTHGAITASERDAARKRIAAKRPHD